MLAGVSLAEAVPKESRKQAASTIVNVFLNLSEISYMNSPATATNDFDAFYGLPQLSRQILLAQIERLFDRIRYKEARFRRISNHLPERGIRFSIQRIPRSQGRAF